MNIIEKINKLDQSKKTKMRSKTTFTVVKFEEGMEDGETYPNVYDGLVKYIKLPNGLSHMITNEDDCYIVKNNNNCSIDIFNKKHIETYYEEIKGSN